MTHPLSIRRPKLVLLLWQLVVVVMVGFIAIYPRIEINPTARTMVAVDDPDIEFDANVKNTLGDDELIVVAIENPKTVFDIPTLTYLDRITSEIEKLPWVRKVYSLTRADNIRGGAGSLIADDLITELPKNQEDLARIEKEAFENPLFVNTLVSPDKKVAGLNVEMKSGHSSHEDAETVEKIYDIIKQTESLKPAEVKTHVSGFPVASYIGGRFMVEDMFIFSGGAVVLLTIIMYLVLRSWHGVAFTMFVAFSSVNVTYGLLTLCGVKVTIPLSSMMAFMTAIGMEYSVYVAFAYQVAVQTGKPGRERKSALAEAIRDVRFTVVMSAACTGAAFVSMVTNPLQDLKLMGVFLGVGTLTCCAAALTIIPAWISLFPFPVPTVEKSKHRWLQSLIDRIGHLDTRRPFVVISGLVVLCVVGVLLLTQMRTDIDAFQYFRPESPIRKDHEFIRTRMAGDTLLPAIVVADKIDAFKDPENLGKLDKLARYAESLPYVTKAVSHADHIKLMNQALHGGGPDQYKLPGSTSAVEQYLMLHNQPDDFHAWIDPDYRTASVMVRMDTMSSTVLGDNERKLEAFAKEQFPTFDTRVVGTTLLIGRSIDTTSMSLLTGLVTAALLIWLIMIIGFRSLRIGTLALIPTLPPALMVYATLPLIGHALDPPTAITGTIALGIAIDDTTWFLGTWISKRRQPGIDNVTAVSQTLSTIGRPMVLSSMVLGSGFMVMLFSRYLTLFWVGLMMSNVAFWSIFWDVLCTPTMVRLFDPKLPRRGFGYKPESAEAPPAEAPAAAAPSTDSTPAA